MSITNFAASIWENNLVEYIGIVLLISCFTLFLQFRTSSRIIKKLNTIQPNDKKLSEDLDFNFRNLKKFINSFPGDRLVITYFLYYIIYLVLLSLTFSLFICALLKD